MRLILLSGNTGKLAELQALVGDTFDEILTYTQWTGEKFEVDEDEKTFEENAIKKARSAPKTPDTYFLADDSGLEVEALDGRPGIHSARYGPPGATAKQQCETLLNVMATHTNRTANFTCCLALQDPSGTIQTVTGKVMGTIATTYQGEGGFGYDPIFIPDGYTTTFGELDKAIKQKISHRAMALAQLHQHLTCQPN